MRLRASEAEVADQVEHAVQVSLIADLGYLAVISAERAERAEPAEASRRVAAARALAGRLALGEHWVTVMADYAAADLARARGELQEAGAETEHGLNIARRGGLRLDTAYGLLALARIAQQAGDAAEATARRARAQRQLAACPDPGFLRAWAGTEDAAGRRSAADSADELSERELAVLRLLSSHLSLREIGNELHVSLNTVKTHTRNICVKLRVSSREQAVARARELGLLARG